MNVHMCEEARQLLCATVTRDIRARAITRGSPAVSESAFNRLAAHVARQQQMKLARVTRYDEPHNCRRVLQYSERLILIRQLP